MDGEYDEILVNVELFRTKRRRTRKVAEIDILAKRGDSYDIYEVKCSPRIAKAKGQIKKIRKHMPKQYKINESYLYWGAAALLIQI